MRQTEAGRRMSEQEALHSNNGLGDLGRSMMP